MKRILSFLFFTMCISIFTIAQKGTVRIFSELKGVSIYLDDQLKGKDLSTLDSVQPGNHYLKVLKDDVIIYGELISINVNEVTTVLVKYNEEVQKKILASKVDAIQKYKMYRLDVMLSTRYVTQTNTTGKSMSFPGYYSSLGVSLGNAVSQTKAVTDWFITQGGDRKISQYEFAKLTNDQLLFKRYEASKKECAKNNIKIMRRKTIAVIVGVGFAVLQYLIISKNNFEFLEGDKQPPLIEFLPISVSLTAFALFQGKKQTPSAYLTIDEVRNKAFEYNQYLKKQYGLPESFEP